MKNKGRGVEFVARLRCIDMASLCNWKSHKSMKETVCGQKKRILLAHFGRKK